MVNRIEVCDPKKCTTYKTTKLGTNSYILLNIIHKKQANTMWGTNMEMFVSLQFSIAFFGFLECLVFVWFYIF